ncbi:hypothetical protein INR49_011970 [Caranx melampygus]|nr:hypothetical protein INR49_011970 [Caranx melampygus]
MAHNSSPAPLTSSLQPPATSEANGTCVDHSMLQIPFAVLYSVTFILGLVGNLVALWVFFCVHSKKNSVRVFLINVAFADLLLVACLPFRILYHSQKNVWNLHPVLCKLVGNLFYMNMYISITLLGLISIDRYLKMHRGSGTQHRLWSTRGSRGLCAVIWIGASAMTLPFVVSKSDNQEAERLLRASQGKPDLPNTARYTRTAKKSFFVLFLFTVCFVPYHLVRIFYITTQITETSCYWMDMVDKANETALLLSAFNSCLDPVMYFLLSSSVRKEVLRLMSVLCVRDLAASSGSSSSAEGDGRTTRGDRGHTNNIVVVSNMKEEQTGTRSNLDQEDNLNQ